MRTLLLLPVLTTVAYLTGRREDTPATARPRRGSVIGRAVRAFGEFNADNIRIWERYLRKQGVGRED